MEAALNRYGEVVIFKNKQVVGYGKADNICLQVSVRLNDDLFQAGHAHSQEYDQMLKEGLVPEDILAILRLRFDAYSGQGIDHPELEAVTKYDFLWGVAPEKFKDYPGWATNVARKSISPPQVRDSINAKYTLKNGEVSARVIMHKGQWKKTGAVVVVSEAAGSIRAISSPEGTEDLFEWVADILSDLSAEYDSEVEGLRKVPA